MSKALLKSIITRSAWLFLSETETSGSSSERDYVGGWGKEGQSPDYNKYKSLIR